MAQTQPLTAPINIAAETRGRGRKPRIDPAIGESARVMRERLGLTQVELAEKADVAEGTVTGLEAGRRTQPHNVEKIAVALGLTVAQLRAGELPDPLARYRDLTDEDLQIARQYHNANTGTRLSVARMLRTGASEIAERIARLDPARAAHVLLTVEMEESVQAQADSAARQDTESGG